MKKCILGLFIFAVGFSLFAQTEKPVPTIFLQPITGIGHHPGDSAFISQMLTNEITTRNYTLLKAPFRADFLVYGTIIPYYKYELDRVRNPPAASTYSYNSAQEQPWDQYVFQLTLKNAITKEIELQQYLTYSSIDDFYNFFPVMMYNLFGKIGENDYESVINEWQNKWVYLRASFDFPITFYKLQGKGLYRETAVYNIDNPELWNSLDNRVVALPAATVGIEVQFLDWCSIEPKLQVGWEHLNDKDFITMAPGIELKFPIKLRNIMLEPYGAVSFPILSPIPALPSTDIFDSYPKVGYGGGVQFGMKGGKSSALFIDVNYMYFGDVGIYNHYGPDYPNPEVIYFKRSVIGLGVGFKVGSGDRPAYLKSNY